MGNNKALQDNIDHKDTTGSFLHKVAGGILKYRFLILALFIIGSIVAFVNMGNVVVESDLSASLPPDSDTTKALDIMSSDFESVTSWDFYIHDIGLIDAKNIATSIKKVKGVSLVSFDTSTNYLEDMLLAKLTIMLESNIEDKTKDDALASIVDITSGYKTQSYSLVDINGTFESEVAVVLVMALGIIILVLMLTTQSILEVPIFLAVFGIAAILNMGSNALLSSISFIAQSVAVVLQLALAIDYSIILSHRYGEERKHAKPLDAMQTAIAFSIKDILSSSLTTITGLLSLVFMQMTLGFDLGVVLAKGIVFSVLTVICVMPTLLLMADKIIKKTTHRHLIPKITKPARKMQKARVPITCIFVGLLIVATVVQSFNSFSYGYENEEYASIRQESVVHFGESDTMGVLVDKYAYDMQAEIISTLESHDEVQTVMGLANIEIIEGVFLTTSYTADEISTSLQEELKNEIGQERILDYIPNIVNSIYYFAGFNPTDKVALIELIEKASDGRDFDKTMNSFKALLALVPLTDNERVELDEYLDSKEDELKLYSIMLNMVNGEEYTIILIQSDVIDDQETRNAFIGRLQTDVYGINDELLFFGDSIILKELEDSFMVDIVKINLLTVIFIFLILVCTFKGLGTPIILLMAIQGSIFISFSIPVIMSTPVFFLSYIVISAIQMGATIDYGIMLTNRYESLKKKFANKSDAMANALNESFPSIITSGLVLTVSGFLVGFMVNDPAISPIGIYLGQGTLISLLVVLLVLPQLLVVFDGVSRTLSFKKKPKKDANSVDASDTNFGNTVAEQEQNEIINTKQEDYLDEVATTKT